MMRSTCLSILSLATLACSGGGEPADGQVPRSDASQEAVLLSESVEGEPCDILTTEMVAEVVGTPADDIRQTSMMSCNYFFGDDGVIIFFGVRVFDDVEGAVEHLAGLAEGMTGEELAAMWDDIVDRARERAGEDRTTAEAAEAVGGAAGAEMSEGIDFEPAPGLGDRAIWETGTSNATVQVANAVVDLQATTGEGVEADRELTRRVFEAVLEELRQRSR